MDKKEKLFYNGAIIALVIALVVCFAKIEDLRTRISNINNSHSRDISNLRSQISSIYNNVDKQMKEQGSLFTSVKREFGSFNAQTQKADVEISVMPKTIIDNMEVNVSLCGTTIKMIKNEKGEYLATIPVGIFEQGDYLPLVTINANGQTKTQYLEDCDIRGIVSKYLPTMLGGTLKTYDARLEKGKLIVDGEFFVGYNLGSADNSSEFIKYTLVTEVSGKEIENRDITEIIKSGEKTDRNGEVDFKFRETYDLAGSDNLTIFLVAQDSLGYLHKKIAFSWYHPDSNKPSPEEPAHAVVEAMYVGEIITDNDGNVLFGKEIK